MTILCKKRQMYNKILIIISSHPLVNAGGELPFIKQFGGYLGTEVSEISKFSLRKFRENYLKNLSSISKNCSIMTDKLPHNFRPYPTVG